MNYPDVEPGVKKNCQHCVTAVFCHEFKGRFPLNDQIAIDRRALGEDEPSNNLSSDDKRDIGKDFVILFRQRKFQKISPDQRQGGVTGKSLLQKVKQNPIGLNRHNISGNAQ